MSEVVRDALIAFVMTMSVLGLLIIWFIFMPPKIPKAYDCSGRDELLIQFFDKCYVKGSAEYCVAQAKELYCKKSLTN